MVLLLDPGAQEAIANWCGWLSIACWLGAQLPQVIKNWQLQSCEGLALPFLINWLAGDFTNLIGCVLTDQLPFQTYLATYFCFVDVALVGQFYYYRRPKMAQGTPRAHHYVHVSPHTSLVLPPPAVRSNSAGGPGTSPLPTVAGLPRTNSGRGRRRTQPPPAHHPLPHPHPHHGHTLSEPYPSAAADALYAAALDVARAAERVSRRSTSARPRARHYATAPPAGDEHPRVDSFHSDLSARSSTADGDDDGDEQHRRLTQSTGALTPRRRGSGDPRGRSLTRISSGLGAESSDTLDDMRESGMLEVRRRGTSRSQSQARTARGSGRRAAGVAFMSLGLVLWRVAPVPTPIGANMGEIQGRVVGRHAVGDVWAASAAGSGSSSASRPLSASASHPPGGWQPTWPLHPVPLPAPVSARTTTLAQSPEDGEPLPGAPREEPIDFKQLVGRVSAWCCTTLYLTSRLPQIWKNFQRKSVEGLSILLFLFAFLGNTFYVLSIVLAPAPPGQAAHYLLRALPYLLGSGGTLLFDLTIMVQAATYGAAPPAAPLEPRHRRNYSYGALRRRRVHTEEGLGAGATGERRPLLAGPSVSPARAATEPPAAWSRRAPSASSTQSISGLWMQTESPTQSRSNTGNTVSADR